MLLGDLLLLGRPPDEVFVKCGACCRPREGPNLHQVLQ